MLESLISIDRTIFLFINGRLANPVTDLIMPVITDGDLLAIGYALCMAAVLIFGSARMRWLVLFSALTLLLTDQAAAGILKPLIARVRPCHPSSGIDLATINLLVPCGAGYALPSAHAATAFGQAVLFGFCAGRFRIALFTVATLIALSRVFVGVHYPTDVAGGAVLGALIAIIIAAAFKLFEARLLLPKTKDGCHPTR